jgi:hypothetical protein
MSTRFNFSLAAIGGATLILTAVGFHQAARARQASTAQLALASQQSGSRAEIARAEQELADWEQARPQLEKEAASLRAIVIVNPRAAPGEEEAKKEQASVLNQEERARGYRSRLVAEYAPFYLKLGLNPEQIDRFETILTDRWQSMEDIAAVAKAQGADGQDSSVEKLREQAEVNMRQAEKALLSETGYRQLREYERTLPVRALTASLAERLYYTEAPLNGAQAEKLTQILAESSQSYGEGIAADPEEIDWPKAMSQAQGVLTPVQLAALEDKRQAIKWQKDFGEPLAARIKAAFPDKADKGKTGQETPAVVSESATSSVSVESSTP